MYLYIYIYCLFGCLLGAFVFPGLDAGVHLAPFGLSVDLLRVLCLKPYCDFVH